MRRKRTPAPITPASEIPVPETVVPEAIIEQARRAIEADRIKRPERCIVCADECAPNSTEGLCWVCRRLKLSAWRDNDSQMSAPE